MTGIFGARITRSARITRDVPTLPTVLHARFSASQVSLATPQYSHREPSLSASPGSSASQSPA